jgi:quinol monooxygenase YgiN
MTLHEALFVRLEAKPGKAAEVEKFLRSGLPLAQGEPRTITWFALRLGPSTFAIFDAFEDDSGRRAHLQGPIAAALMAKAPELLATPPLIENASVLAAKLP